MRNIDKKTFLPLLLLLISAGCSLPGSSPGGVSQTNPTESVLVVYKYWHKNPIPSIKPDFYSHSQQHTFPTPTEIVFGYGKELTIKYLREMEISGSEIVFHERLSPGYNYARHLVSYTSEGNRIFGLLTVPFEEPPEDGFKAIVFNHGYIPPAIYQTTERYAAYVDYLARNGFVVLKIDYRGHGNSEGNPQDPIFPRAIPSTQFQP